MIAPVAMLGVDVTSKAAARGTEGAGGGQQRAVAEELNQLRVRRERV